MYSVLEIRIQLYISQYLEYLKLFILDLLFLIKKVEIFNKLVK